MLISVSAGNVFEVYYFCVLPSGVHLKNIKNNLHSLPLLDRDLDIWSLSKQFLALPCWYINKQNKQKQIT